MLITLEATLAVGRRGQEGGLVVGEKGCGSWRTKFDRRAYVLLLATALCRKRPRPLCGSLLTFFCRMERMLAYQELGESFRLRNMQTQK